MITASILALGLAMAKPGLDPQKVAIDRINAEAAAIDSAWSRGDLRCTETSSKEISEGLPPVLEACRAGDTLRRIRIQVGHESWSSVFTYYFQNGKLAKYSSVSDQPGNGKRWGILYGTRGEILWKNIDSPRVPVDRLVRILDALDSIREEFSGYQP